MSHKACNCEKKHVKKSHNENHKEHHKGDLERQFKERFNHQFPHKFEIHDEDDHHENNNGAQNNKVHTNELKLEQARLWEDHFWKTRIVVQAAASSNACLAADIKTLYANQDELGTNFGQLTRNVNAGKELAKELREHIRIAIEIVVAALAKKPTDALYKQWQKNATAIAEVYHKYNRNIRFETVNKLMQEHLKTTLAEAVAIIGGNCEDSVKKGDVALHHVREMADYINSKF